MTDGELLLAIPKATPNNNPFHENRDESNLVKSKIETIQEMGYSKDEASDYQRMAKNPEIVQRVMDEAIANGDVVTKSQVMKEIAEAKRKADAENEQLRKALSESETRRIAAERKGSIRQVEIKEVEVPPADYNTLKARAKEADAWKKDYQKEQLRVSEKNKEILNLNDRIRELEDQTAQATSSAKLIEGSIYFVAQCGSFVRDMGGYVWIADSIAELPERERINFIKAVRAIHDWAEVLQQNIERSNNEQI